MNRRERLLNSLLGKPVDRPCVNFYEVGGFLVDHFDKDEFNVYNSPDWKEILDLAENETEITRFVLSDLIYMDLTKDYLTTKVEIIENKKIYKREIRCKDRVLTGKYIRERDVDTLWCVEHFFKDVSDIESFLKIPAEAFISNIDVNSYKKIEADLGNAGLLMIDISAPVSEIAQMMDMTDFWIFALRKEKILYKFLDKISEILYHKVNFIAKEMPNQLWRIVGPEVVCEPYLPNEMFKELVIKYTEPMIHTIKSSGGFARVHCHGRVKSTLPFMVDMGIDAIDPLEPLPQGDVSLLEVRKEFGKHITLFGNIEACDIENLRPDKFKEIVKQSVYDGTFGEGRGFVLLPSASPYGRNLSPYVLENYKAMIEAVNNI